MADQATNDVETEEQETADKAPSTLKPILMVLGFMTTVVVLECVGVSMFMPSAEELESIAQGGDPGILQPGGEIDILKFDDSGEDHREVDLGQFSLTAFQPERNYTLRIDFHLSGTVLEDDLDDFEEIKKTHQNRMREQVIVIMRKAVITDLTDPTLALIKRQILEKSNRVLGKTLLQSIVIGDFSFVEQ